MSTFSEVYLPVTTTGSAGSATGSKVSGVINGLIYSIYVKYHASAPSSTDVTIAETNGATRTFLTLTNVNTSGTKPAYAAVVDATGTALSSYVAPALAGRTVTVSVAGADALTNAVEVYLYVLE